MRMFETASNDTFEVRGRGELHLGVLIESMRREGFELGVSPPRVVFKRDRQSKDLLEPVEEVVIDVPTEMSGTIIQKLSRRRGDLKSFTETGDQTRLIFEIPSRGLLGYQSEFKYDTSGKGVLQHAFIGYKKHCGEVDKSRRGSLVSLASGNATAYALQSIESRGTLFIKPGDSVYAGMVIGEHNKDVDMGVNPVKAKQITNVRSVSKDEMVKLSPVKSMSLEQTLSYVRGQPAAQNFVQYS